MTGLEVLAIGYLGMKIATGVAIGRHYFAGDVPEIEPTELAQWLMSQGGTAPLVEVNEQDIDEEEELGYIDQAKAWWDGRDVPPDNPNQAFEEQEQQEAERSMSFFEKVGKTVSDLGSSIGTEKPKEASKEPGGEAERGDEEGVKTESPGFMDKARTWWNTPTEETPEEVAPEVEIIPNEGPIQLVDVRTEYEYASGHIPGAHWVSFIPPWSLKSRLRRLGLDKDAVVVAICWSAHRSVMCCKELQDLGYKTKHLRGGMIKWRSDELHLPEVSGDLPDGGYSEPQTPSADLIDFEAPVKPDASAEPSEAAAEVASQEDLISF